MAFRRYHTVDGLLLGETGPSGRRDYLPDAVGSVSATVDPTATVKNTYRFKPYGAFLVQGGPEADPRFLWTGETGSRVSGAPHAGQYNRARTYARETGRWTSVDPLWPMEKAYEYVEGNPVNWVDPSGLQQTIPQIPPPTTMPIPGTGSGGIGGGTIPSPGPGTITGPGTRIPDIPTYLPPPSGGATGTIHPQPPPRPRPVWDLPDYALIPLPDPGEFPRHDPIMCDARRQYNPCIPLKNTKDRWCSGNNKRGTVRGCSLLANGRVTRELCNLWRKDIPEWKKCCDARWDELRWRCLPTDAEQFSFGLKMGQVKGHYVQAIECQSARQNCEDLYKKHCKGRFAGH